MDFTQIMGIGQEILYSGVIIVVYLALYKIMGFLPAKLDDIWKVDKSLFTDIKKIVMNIALLIGIFILFYIWGIQDILQNKIFQLIALFIGMRLALNFLGSSIRKIDEAIEEFDFSENTHVLIEKGITYAIYITAILIGFYILGVTDLVTAALAGAGIMGIAIGFAAKDIFGNILAGLFMIFDQPFKIGEVIEVSSTKGTVKDISLRTTKLKTFDGKFVTIPNSLISTNAVVNYSRNKYRRINISVGIAYEANLNKAIHVLKELLKKNTQLSTSKKYSPKILVSNIGESSVDLSVRAWVNTRKHEFIEVESKLREKMLKEFGKNKIEIPYPKRVVYSG